VLWCYSTLAYAAPELLSPPADGRLQGLVQWFDFVLQQRYMFDYTIGEELRLAHDIQNAHFTWRGIVFTQTQSL
jgi:hypothetical protein